MSEEAPVTNLSGKKKRTAITVYYVVSTQQPVSSQETSTGTSSFCDSNECMSPLDIERVCRAFIRLIRKVQEKPHEQI